MATTTNHNDVLVVRQLIGAIFSGLCSFTSGLSAEGLKRAGGTSKQFVHVCSKNDFPIFPHEQEAYRASTGVGKTTTSNSAAAGGGESESNEAGGSSSTTGGLQAPQSSSEEQFQRAAIRACLISMPAEVCKQLPQELVANVETLLAEEMKIKGGPTDAMSIPEISPGVSLWQGDMSLLSAGAVMNPANNMLLGCFLPSHKCLDNILHAQSGPRLRIACQAMKEGEGIQLDDNGQCRVTPGFSLPSQYVFHTVGPNLVSHWNVPARAPTEIDRAELKSCYLECLDKALELKVKSLAFCCISTGIFGYPSQEAARIALETTRDWLQSKKKSSSSEGEDAGENSVPKIVFNTFLDNDTKIYAELAPQVFETQ